jgi:radical SAM superfamily enzyme YgiQ (UPF0313 family)
MRILYLPNSSCQQRQFEKPNFQAYPVLMAMEAEWYRKQGHIVYWDAAKEGYSYKFVDTAKGHTVYREEWKWDKIITKPEGLPFLALPHSDRIFTKAKDKIYQQNGNFKYHPGTYIQAANGCWHGKCTYCIEQHNKWEVREVDDVISEIEECKAMGFKEIFDDSGTFPTGNWLYSFASKLNGIHFSCNMRAVDLDYKYLHSRGFRMLLMGVESANQKTLDRINKGTKEEDVKYIIKAAKAGIEPHVAVMFGYPWETDKEAENTLRLVHYLLRKGYCKTAQASYYTPNDGTGNNESQRRYIKRIYNISWYADFWFNQLKDIKDVDDIKYLWNKIKAGLWRK